MEQVQPIRVVMSGPLRPAVGGMATVIQNMAESSLAQKVALQLFNSAKQTPPGRSLWRALKGRFRIWQQWWRAMAPLPHTTTIAHIHTCSGLTFFLDAGLVSLAKLRQAAVVLHIHGGRFDAFLDGLPKSLLGLARWVARRANVVIALSESWQDRLTQRLPGARIAVIKNGVPVQTVSRRSSAGEVVRILFLGKLSGDKGVWEMLAAMPDVSPQAVLLLAGGDEEPGMRMQVEAAIRSRGLEHRVQLLGPVVGAAKADSLAKADIFVLPSHAEGLPVALLEAMAAGLPVVATPVGAIGSVVADGEHGRLVPVGDAKALSGALTALAEDPALRTRMGQAARARCTEVFSIESTVDAYMRVYRALVG